MVGNFIHVNIFTMGNELQVILTCLGFGVVVFAGNLWYNKDAFGEYLVNRAITYGALTVIICAFLFALVAGCVYLFT